METVSYGDFAKLDLKVASIISAEKVEGSEKLLKLQIKVGEEERTLVAGISAHYAPDTLVGKKIIVIANLEPRRLKGIESQGMLLAAEDSEGHLALLVPDREIPDGTQVR